MASVLVALTVALAFFKEGLLKWLRGRCLTCSRLRRYS
jgi:hypothetical protein